MPVDPTDRIRNLALSADARTFPLVANVPEPQEGQVLEFMPESDYPFEIIKVKRKCGGPTGSELTIRLEIDGDIVDMDDTDSGGDMPCTEPVLVTSEPDGSHYIVPEQGTLYCYLENLTTDVADVVIQITCRRTEENVLVTE
jgi:hypothetical protein